MTGSKGEAMPSTPTVSVWPHSIRARPGALPSMTPTTFGRPGPASVNSTSTPPARRAAAIRSATAASPAPPETSEGLTESMATRSRSRVMTESNGDAQLCIAPRARDAVDRPGLQPDRRLDGAPTVALAVSFRSGSPRLEVVLPQLDVDRITLGSAVSPQLPRSEAHRVDVLRKVPELLAAPVGVLERIDAVVSDDRATLPRT